MDMSAPVTVLSFWPSKLMEIWQSYDENNFGLFYWDTVKTTFP